MFKKLQSNNVVLFGAGKNGKKYLNQCLTNGIVPLYFVDNNNTTRFIYCDVSTGKSGAMFAVNNPKMLALENKENLKIIITPNPPLYDEIRKQIIDMGLENCIENGEQEEKNCYCVVCNKSVSNFLPFVNEAYTINNARCPICNAFARHRGLWFYINDKLLLPDKNGNEIKLLHFAPEKCLFSIINNNKKIDYYPVDFNPNAPNIRAIVDVTDIPYENDMFDLIICSHVLEHVPNDAKAMSELKRVLSPTGVAFINVPRLSPGPTHEDLTFTPEERIKHYGQTDHVRRYGEDYPTRLSNAGFTVEIIDVCENRSEEEKNKYGFDPNERIFKCTK